LDFVRTSAICGNRDGSNLLLHAEGVGGVEAGGEGVLVVAEEHAVLADECGGITHILRHLRGQVGRVGLEHPLAVDVLLRCGPGVEGCGVHLFGQDRGCGVRLRVGVGEAGEGVINNQWFTVRAAGLQGQVGVEGEVAVPRLGVVANAGAEDEAGVGSRALEAGAGAPGQAEDAALGGAGAEGVGQAAPVLLAGEGGVALIVEQGGFLAADLFDSIAGLGDVAFDRVDAGQDLPDADRGGGLLQLALKALFRRRILSRSLSGKNVRM
jgi:hypothetical protein